MMDLTEGLSSLDINERHPSAEDNNKLPQINTMSLPNLVSTEKPIDVSKKYCGTKINDERKIIKPENNCTYNKVVKSYNTFTMYAETDLDQPTDYSLRYAEDDSDSEQCNKLQKTETAEFVQDTIKTYCTEDTPYETPFNFSTSTSMSDLRIDDKTHIENKLDSDPKDVGINAKEASNKIVKSEFSSGLMSPEKPVNYCDEGTPGYFSRVASCGSLNLIPINDPPKQELKEEKKELRRVGKFSSETKAVKFEEVVNYAEETPLMFSRSSSLASLDSIEQHSIHDDRSSVVSDFSRLTSGLISPSELPDSPSQTIPPSPKSRKNPIVFSQNVKKNAEDESTKSPQQNVPETSIFEDVVKKFKMESTPLQFSTATSLSSLIDDPEEKVLNSQNQNDINNDKNELNNLGINNDLSESSEDEDILAACINIGMQNNRYSQSKAITSPPNDISSYKLRTSPQNSAITVPISPLEVSQNNSLQKTDLNSDSIRTYYTEDTPAILSQAGSNSDLSILSLHVESKIPNNCEEDNSPDTQNSKLCDLQECRPSIEPIEVKTNENNHSHHSSLSSLSDDSHESEQALLQECILAGMPKPNISLNKSDDSKEKPLLNLVDIQTSIVDESSDEEDQVILADCINSGIKNNKYNQPKLNKVIPSVRDKSEAINDSIKSYYTEDTPAVLSNAGSTSDLSVLSAQANGTGEEKDELSDLSNFSDEDDEKLLEECVRYGMAKITGTANFDQSHKFNKKNYFQGSSTRAKEKGKVDLNISLENNISDDDSTQSLFSLSDDSYESDRALLQECILAGMPKRPPPPPKPLPPSDLTPAEKALLQQCILEGMRKCRITPKKAEQSDLTQSEQALLRECILSGMPKNKNLSVGGPSASRDSAELTESERSLLQQCILAGMPKSRRGRRRRGEERAEHACCVHCPRNSANRVRQNGRRRRRYREKQVRESRDVSILYVTSQIVAVKKEVVDRSREEWV